MTIDLAPVWDAGGPLLLALFGAALLGVIILSALIVIIEALILWRRFSYGLLSRSILASLVMNITSTIAGVILVIVGRAALGAMPLFLISWVITVVIEAGVLRLMNRQATGAQIWKMSLTVNIVSYLLLIALVFWYYLL